VSRQPRPAHHAARASARAAAAAAAVAALVGLSAAGCDGGPIAANNPQSSGQSFVGSSYTSTVFQAGHRPQAPSVSGVTVTGRKLSLASYRGDVVVLNFWGSWCAPCRAEAPALGTLARQLAARNVRFVGIDIRDEPQSALAFMQQFRIGYPSLNDPGDEIALQFRATVPPAAIPTTIVIDRGQIAARIVGGASYRQLKSLINEVTGQRS
jgi:thiol-disulfide isomerase/thioredoxin